MSPPSALISLARAASRSVSCVRVCASPVKTEGDSATAAAAVSTGASSLTSHRSAVMPLIRPVPVMVSPSTPTSHRAPIRVSTSRIAPAACRLSRGQSPMVTVPPVTSAAARNGPALDRSGSTVTAPRLSRPGRTRQASGRPPGPASPDPPGPDPPGPDPPGPDPPGPDQPDCSSATSAPAARSIRTVMAMCGAEGTGGPSCRISMPSSNRGADSSRPETSCEDPDASSTTVPPRTAPWPCTVNGTAARPPSSICAPSCRSAARIGPTGRCLARHPRRR